MKTTILSINLTLSLMTLVSPETLITWIIMEMTGFTFLSTCSIKKTSWYSVPFILPMQFASATLMLISIISESTGKDTQTLMILAIMMKMGVYPFSAWMISAFKEMDWMSCLIMMTSMKIPPMMMLTMKEPPQLAPIIMLTLSPLVLTMMSINLSSPKIIMAISSGIQSSWMLNCFMISQDAWVLYFLAYSTSCWAMVWSIKTMFPSSSTTENPMENSEAEKLIMVISTMALIGMPPMIMFAMKMKLLMMISSKMMMPTLSLIFSSSLSVVFYSRLMAAMMLAKKSNMKKIKMEEKKNLLGVMLVTVAMTMMMFI